MLHRTIRDAVFRKEMNVKTFENATSLVLAIAAQALAVGVLLAL
jgi:hypothetical protein